MGYSSSINGVIEGISEESFLLIKEELEDAFVEVDFYPETVEEITTNSGQIKRTIVNKGGAIEIRSHGKHSDARMQPVYDKIAFCIDDSGGGCLEYEGEDAGDMATIFFTARRWEMIWAQIQWPQNPFI